MLEKFGPPQESSQIACWPRTDPEEALGSLWKVWKALGELLESSWGALRSSWAASQASSGSAEALGEVLRDSWEAPGGPLGRLSGRLVGHNRGVNFSRSAMIDF